MSITTLFDNYAEFRHRHPDGDVPHNPYKWAMAIDLDACSARSSDALDAHRALLGS